MELPMRPQGHRLIQFAQDLFKPFRSPAPLLNDGIEMMPMNQVKDQLMAHYVKQSPLTILFEFYDPASVIQMAELELSIDSPIQPNETVRVSHRGHSFQLELNQIINVTAITSQQIA